MDISVIVPFYNADPYITPCLQALLTQSYPAHRYEIIMVDNNSTDGSAAKVALYPRAQLLSEARQGSYAARNRGLRAASGNIIAFTDPDCVPAPDWLENLRGALQRPEVGIVLGPRRFASESGGLALLQAYETEKARYVCSGSNPAVCFGYTNKMGVRRVLLDRLGPFPEVVRGGDTVWLRRAVDAYSCEVVCFAPTAWVRHLEITSVWDFYRKQTIRGRSNQNISSMAAFQTLSLRDRLRVFRRTRQRGNYSGAQAALLWALLVLGAGYYEYGRWRALGKLEQERIAETSPGNVAT